MLPPGGGVPGPGGGGLEVLPPRGVPGPRGPGGDPPG